MEETPTIQEVQPTENLAEMTRAQLLERMKDVLQNPNVNEIRDSVEIIRSLFYQKPAQFVAPAVEDEQSSEETPENVEEQPAEVLSAGDAQAEEKKPKANVDPEEAEFKQLYAEYRRRKAEYTRNLEEEQAANYQKKLEIIEKIKELINSQDEQADTKSFKELQAQWNEIGAVPVTKSTALWQEYNALRERFFDMKKVEAQLRDYAFKKNLESKTQIIEQAEALLADEDVLKAFQGLQKLHDQWREIGPVDREVREEIWNKFKGISTQINRRHQDYYTNLRRMEEELIKEKEALCQQVEQIDVTKLLTSKDWDEKSKFVISFNDKFQSKTPTERRVNQRMYKRYRSACDNFFAAKTIYFQKIRDEQQANLDRKRALVEQVEQLKNSKDWSATSDKIRELQKEWKTIGAVPRRFSDAIWEQFTAACNYFFDQKSAASKERRNEEQTNLRMKMEIIEQIKAFEFTGNDDDDYSKLRMLADQFAAVGHIPFKDKDKVFEMYKKASSEKFAKIKNRRRAAQLHLDNDKGKLTRYYENLKQQIATYENNIGFFKNSKGTMSIVRDLEQKIRNLKEDLALVSEQIRKLEQEKKD